MQSRSYYPGVDALRGVAIILVLIHHLFGYSQFSSFGWMGVDLFFVISGFLITNILIGIPKTLGSLKSFYVRRILRIFPLYYLTLVLFFSFAGLLFNEKGPGSVFIYYTSHQAWFWMYMQNWLFIKSGSPPLPYLIHFWSLAIEEQFYLLWPVLILSIKSLDTLKKITIGLIVISLVTRCIIYQSNPSILENYYYNTFTRMDALMCGSILSINKKQLVNKVLLFRFFFLLGALFLIVSIFLTGNVYKKHLLSGTIGYTILALFFLSLLYFFLRQKNLVVEKLTQWRPLLFVSKISYGIYIFHFPVYLIVTMKLKMLIPPTFIGTAMSLWYMSFVSLVITILISHLSYKYFESPLLNLKKRYIY